MAKITRRDFVNKSMKGAAVLAAGTSVHTAARGESANEKVVVALLGAGGRGRHVMRQMAALENVECKFVCDLEDSRGGGAVAELEKIQGSAPKFTKEMREVFDDKDVHGVLIATPEQWHALGTVLACQAGKDVYVEKCISRKIGEGRKMIEAARKYKRVVQAGTQSRSGPYSSAAREYIKEGRLGDVLYAKVYNMLGSVYGGYPLRKPADGNPPAGFDWDKWLGPAPERPYNSAVHRNWHGYWDFSGGNSSDGIHQLDLARMALGDPPHPNSVTCVGGRWRYDDDGHMPDVHIVSFQFDKMAVTFENTGFTPVCTKTPGDIRAGKEFPYWPQNATRIEIYGTKGMMYLGRHGGGWQVKVAGGKVVDQQFGDVPDKWHVPNFIDCIRSRKLPNADVEQGHLSACLEHLGNIAYRTGNQKLVFDGKTETFVDNDEANQYIKPAGRKQYRMPDEG